ncbi:hypothetical protein OAM67_01065 [bacterium]|nr:hypothetical protein [bacterium]
MHTTQVKTVVPVLQRARLALKKAKQAAQSVCLVQKSCNDLVRRSSQNVKSIEKRLRNKRMQHCPTETEIRQLVSSCRSVAETALKALAAAEFVDTLTRDACAATNHVVAWADGHMSAPDDTVFSESPYPEATAVVELTSDKHDNGIVGIVLEVEDDGSSSSDEQAQTYKPLQKCRAVQKVNVLQDATDELLEHDENKEIEAVMSSELWLKRARFLRSKLHKAHKQLL